MTQEPPISSDNVISSYLNLLRQSPAVPQIAASALSTVLPARDSAIPCALLVSPHPDDECLTGLWPLRLRQEQGWQIINIPVTLGSNTDRRARRAAELAKACAVLGFDCALPQENGFEKVTAETRLTNAPAWQKMTARLAGIIAHCQPRALFLPHAQDAHPAHVGAHFLGMDALSLLGADFSCAVVQTEYWQANENPNVMIGASEEDAAKLLSALACHEGENARNLFDARFPAFLIDNVRRGSERVGGQGVASAPMDFAMLYQFGLWKNGKFMPSALKRIVGFAETVNALFS